MKDSSLTPASLAQRIPYKADTIGQAWRGNISVSPKLAYMAAPVLGVTAEWILFGEAPPRSNGTSLNEGEKGGAMAAEIGLRTAEAEPDYGVGERATIVIVGQCPRCKSQVKVGASTCPHCGRQLSWPDIKVEE